MEKIYSDAWKPEMKSDSSRISLHAQHYLWLHVCCYCVGTGDIVSKYVGRLK